MQTTNEYPKYEIMVEHNEVKQLRNKNNNFKIQEFVNNQHY